ncbi:hypothetical protein NUU61_000134 [Penicillium alfredii]|uniref:Uncharacterized protein n=1 Tax=Penicillium alfredii TaxID=1506179 RepID=A0A9W9KQC5_9EURO|nr:uncharacterized protein NUU61_000134 [Penicillium alfredii]KAJ5114375.1 hypothetical protein NUU61_000134 [Penicillium alfredii]
MRLGSVLNIFGAVALAGLQLVAAAPAHHHTKALQPRTAPGSARTLVDYCNQDDLNGLDDGISELKEMLEATMSRLEDLWKYLNQDHVPLLWRQDFKLQSTFRTFESLYGRLSFNLDKSGHQETLDRVEWVARFAETFRASLDTINARDDFEIYCGDWWLQEKPKFFQWIKRSGDLWFFDHRPSTKYDTEVNMAGGGGLCRKDDVFYAAWVQPQTPTDMSHDRDVLTICQNEVALYTKRFLAGDTMRNMRKKDFVPEEQANTVLDSVTSTCYAMSLAHEGAHVKVIFQDRQMIDVPVEVNGQTASAYGWERATALARESSEKAKKNADTFALLVAAMYLDRYDWSTGVARRHFSGVPIEHVQSIWKIGS